MVKIYRGNHAYLTFTRSNEEGVISTIPHNIYFTIKINCGLKVPVIQKRYIRDGDVTGEIVKDENDKWIVSILPEDTANLEFGEYIVDVKIENEDGLELTIVPPTPIEIAKVVTHYNYNEG